MTVFTLKTEERNGYVVSSEMKKVWAVQLDLLKKLLDVCSRYHLKIWADSGTAIGAVRHQGYIPWDDDIDMAMFREDYDKLIAIGDKVFEYPYFLQTGYSDRNYPRGHAQLRNSKTTAIRPADILTDFNQGIFIDIFVYDAVPDDRNAFNNELLESEKYRSLMKNHVYGHWLTKNPIRFVNYLLGELYFCFHTFKDTFSKFEKVFKDYNKLEHQNVAYLGVRKLRKESYIHKKEWFDKIIYMPFEDLMIPVPKAYDEILRKMYGNYMKPVKAPSQHGEIVFDTEHSYVEILKELRLKLPWYKKF